MKDGSDRLSCSLTIRLSGEEMQALDEEAKRLSRSRGNMLRYLLREYLRKEAGDHASGGDDR